MKPLSTARALVRRMIVDADCEQDCADAIGQFEGWIAPPDWRRNRLMQCLRGVAGRHFELEWVPIVLRIVARNGGSDLVTGLMHQAVADGVRDREEDERRAPMARVEPQGRLRGRA